MKNPILIAAIVGILLVSSASADLVMNPTNLNIKLKVNEERTFNITLTNTYDFRITNFRFSNLTGFTFPNITLEPQQSKFVEFKVKIPEATTRTINSQVAFSYIVTAPSQPKAYQVNITENGFSPSFLVIHDGDSVTWKNLDSITHTVTSATFDIPLAPNASTSKQFSSLGEIAYQDLILFYGATIQVVNKSLPQEVSNPLLNRVLQVNLEVTSEPTSLIVSSQVSSFTVAADGSQEGSLRVSNVGQHRAEHVHLTSTNDWIRFDENDFDVEANGTNFVNYLVLPTILETEETNRSYQINVSVKGANTQDYSLPLTVFVPFSDLDSGSDDIDGALARWERYCETRQYLFICNSTVLHNEGQERVIIRDPQIPVNLTASQVYDLLKRTQRIEDSNQRTDNKLKEVADQFGVTVPQLLTMLNQSVTQQLANEERSRYQWIALWIGVGFIILAGGIVGVMFAYKRYHDKKMLHQGVIT